MQSKSGRRFHFWTKLAIRLQQCLAIVQADLSKLRHEPFELFMRMIQPAIWLLIFGQAMANARTIPTTGSSYLDYMAPGILAQSILFIGIFYGIALIWERDRGILHKILVSPCPRSLLVLGRSISAGIRGLSQMVVIYLIAFLLGVHLRFSFFSLLGICAIIILSGATFSTLSLLVASLVKKRERFMGIGQVLTMPLFFASNALYPLEMMPSWLQNLSLFNPLTYQVDAMRYLMIAGEASQFGLWTDFGLSLLALCLLIAIATPIFPRILY
jgi:ABC-2 type transport system permease protein